MYRAKDTQTGALVAVKHLKPEAVAHDASLVQRFTREAEALRQLDHPNIVKVLMENRKQIHTMMWHINNS